MDFQYLVVISSLEYNVQDVLLELVLDQEVGLEVLQNATKSHYRELTKILELRNICRYE